MALNTFHLFAGAGGGILADILLGHNPIGACEIEKYPRDVLLARQRDGILPAFPIWDDVRTFDGRPWRGRVDILAGGFPCQDISAAGKGAGIGGERSGLWSEFARIIGEVRPRFAFVENSPMLTSRGLGRVLGDLAAMGYDAQWGVLGACDAGAPHKRERIWILAYSQSIRIDRVHGNDSCPTPKDGHGSDKSDSRSEDVADALRCGPQGSGEDGAATRQAGLCNGERRNEVEDVCHTPSTGLPHGIKRPMGEPGTQPEPERSDWWETEPDVGRVAHGVAARVDRLKAIGNGQVSSVAALAWETLLNG